ncbi:hypothetical protein C8R44DRAFT_753655 [Mycena epipterygia]|nr:hypothetical protein C8R44DRAFT_753655 [Mycena epipterygia]
MDVGMKEPSEVWSGNEGAVDGGNEVAEDAATADTRQLPCSALRHPTAAAPPPTPREDANNENAPHDSGDRKEHGARAEEAAQRLLDFWSIRSRSCEDFLDSAGVRHVDPVSAPRLREYDIYSLSSMYAVSSGNRPSSPTQYSEKSIATLKPRRD